jgi:hypothetical protein
MPGESSVRVSAGIVEVLREMVQCGQGAALLERSGNGRRSSGCV